MSFSEFDDDWNEDEIIWFHRKEKECKRKFDPKSLKESILESLLSRIMNNFEKEKFGIISAYQRGKSKHKNFEAEFILTQRIRSFGFRSEAHIGFWDGIGERCLFIPKIEREEVKALAKEFNQNTYIWGEKEDWTCYKTSDDDILAIGDNLKIICPDEEFLLFSRIKKREQHFLTLLDYIKDESKNGSIYHRDTVSSIKRKLKDLERIEDEIISAKKWNPKKKL
jgi:hypothetical protein